MTYIDMERWPRKAHFDLYGGLAQPHFNLCAPLNVTALVPWCKARQVSFFTAVLYAVTRAANAIPELRYRLRPEGVIEHKVVHPSFTVLGENGLFGFCVVEYTDDWPLFAARTTEGIAAARANLSLEDDPRDDMLFITSIPWVSFTSMQHPVAGPSDSFPRMAWGRYTEENGAIKMPLSVHAHHALVDGLHVGNYFTALQAAFEAPETYYGE